MTSWKPYTAKDYVGDKKDVRQLGKPRRNCSAYLPLRKSDERRFSRVGGRISQCLAAEHRQIKVVRRVDQLQAARVERES